MFFKKYKIQQFHEPETNIEYYGLFKRAGWKGKGYGMGWYGAEYYTFAKLIAYAPLDTKECIRKKCWYRKILIFSILAEDVIKAKSDEEAIKIFEKYVEERYLKERENEWQKRLKVSIT